MNKPKVYVGCALKHAPDEYKNFITALKEVLKKEFDFEILEFASTPGATPEEVFSNDITDCVMNCDYMIADFTHPSTGLGYEVATMLEKRGKQVIGVVQESAIVSGLIVGIPYEKFSFDRYSKMEDLVEIVRRRAGEH